MTWYKSRRFKPLFAWKKAEPILKRYRKVSYLLKRWTVKFRDWAQKTVADIKKFLATVEGFSAFEAFDLAALQAQLEALNALAAEIKVSYPAREGLEQFLDAKRSTPGAGIPSAAFLEQARDGVPGC